MLFIYDRMKYNHQYTMNQIEKNDSLIKLYSDIFAVRTDYIPLIITPKDMSLPKPDEFSNNLKTAFQKAIHASQAKAEINADWLPIINISYFQCIAIPSIFKATIVNIPESEPIPKPLFSSVQQALEVPIPELKGSIIEKLLADISQAQKLLPEGWNLSFPPTASPFDLATLLLGDSFFADMILSPSECKAFLQLLTELCIELFTLVKKHLGLGENQWITNRGIFFPGLRLPCDTIVNYSPALIEKFVLPVLESFAKELGPLCLHFCTEPAPAGHVLPVLLKSDSVLAVDNWQGFNVFAGDNSPVHSQRKISLISTHDLSSEEKIDAFFELPFVKNISRKNNRAIVVATETDSVETGKILYKYWQKKQNHDSEGIQ